jgi:hypothetical protein
MPITLRNKVVEAQIRDIGRRTGEGPSAVIARVVGAEHARAVRPEEDAAARLARMRAFLDALPPWTDEERAASRAIEDDMYDEDGLPK